MASIKYLAPDTDAYVDFVVGHRHEFTEATGLDVTIEMLPSDEYFSNDIHRYLDGDDPSDVYMSGPVLLWAHIGAEFVQPLDEHIAGSTTEFDVADFFDPLLSSNRWTGRFGDQLGTGPLWEIPVNCESYNLAYVPSILDTHRLEVPRTWVDYFATANQLVDRSHGAVRGFGQRGIQVWHTMYTGYASQFWSWGATDFDESGRCAIASPAGVAATTAFIDALRQSGPTDFLNQRWYELALDFCAGRYGMIVDSDHYVAFYEDPAISSVLGQVGYAPPLEGPAGVAASNLWTWSLVMNAAVAQPTQCLAVHRVGSGARRATTCRTRGEHEPHACEHLGR